MGVQIRLMKSQRIGFLLQTAQYFGMLCEPPLSLYLFKPNSGIPIFYRMKRTITLLVAICGFASSTAFAQITTINPPTVVYGGFNDQKLEAAFDVQNVGSSSVDVHVNRTETNMVSGSASSFCWGIACYPPTTSHSNTPQTIDGGATDPSFLGYYHPQGNAGVSTVRWTFYVVGDSAATVQDVDVDYDASFANSIADITLENKLGVVSPNPADKTTALNYSFNGNNAEIVIMDMLGAEVHRYDLNAPQGVTILNVSGLKNGIYFYSLIVDGDIQATKKMVVAHR